MRKRTRHAPCTLVYLLRLSVVERDQTPEWLISLETPDGSRHNLATLEHLMNFLEQSLQRARVSTPSAQASPDPGQDRADT